MKIDPQEKKNIYQENIQVAEELYSVFCENGKHFISDDMILNSTDTVVKDKYLYQFGLKHIIKDFRFDDFDTSKMDKHTLDDLKSLGYVR